VVTGLNRIVLYPFTFYLTTQHSALNMDTVKLASKRNGLFIFFSILALLIFYTPLREVLRLAFYERLYAHMLLVPFVSGYFIFLKRRQMVLQTDYSFNAGIIISLIGILLFGLEEKNGLGLSQSSHLSLAVLSALIFWIGGFVLFYGVAAFKIASFPLLFLVFMVPIPGRVLETIIFLLRIGSAEATYGFFNLTGVPVLREGFTFHLPGLSIEIAEGCSGINSSIALFVASIVASQLFLRTGWKKVVFVLSVIPITILKNWMRIVTLSFLGIYIDQRIFYEFHKIGGIPFYIVAIALLVAPVLWWLRKTEKKEKDQEKRNNGILE
jgi:exosortase